REYRGENPLDRPVRRLPVREFRPDGPVPPSAQRAPSAWGSVHDHRHRSEPERPRVPAALSSLRLGDGSHFHRLAVPFSHRVGEPVPLLLHPVAHCLWSSPLAADHAPDLRPAWSELPRALPVAARRDARSAYAVPHSGGTRLGDLGSERDGP